MGTVRHFDVTRVGDSKESNDVEALYQSRDGTIWCGTAAGLYSFRSQDREPGPHLTRLGDSGQPEVTALVEDSLGNLWVSTLGALFRRRPTGEIDSVHIPLSGQRTSALVVDGHGRLWAGGFGLVGIDTATEPPRILPLKDVFAKTTGWIRALYKGEHGEIWIGGSTGLVRFRPDASPPQVLAYTPSHEFPIQQVRSIEQDVRHNLWLAVGTRGAVRIAAEPFELFTKADGLDSSEVVGLAESLRGSLYAVTGQWILNELRGNRFAPTPLRVPHPGLAWAIGHTVLQDREGAWWAASGVGVVRYPPTMDARRLKGKTPERIYSVRDGLPNATILRIFQDSRGDIWAGAADGLGHWSRTTGRWQGFRTADLIPGAAGTSAVHSFAEDSSGDVWAGLYTGGLVRCRGTGYKLLVRGVPGGAINSLLSDRQRRLWIGSSQGGVGRIDNPAADEPRIRRHGLEQGLSSEHVFSLVEDDWGRIYVAGGRGVDRLDPKTATLHHFTPSSGLPPGETEFLFHDRYGSIWFASFYGLARYRPEPDQTPEAPVPMLRALRLGGQPHPISATWEQAVSGIDLAPGHNNVEVEFRALHFDTGEGLHYQYRLEGSDTGGATLRTSRPSGMPTSRRAVTTSPFALSLSQARSAPARRV